MRLKKRMLWFLAVFAGVYVLICGVVYTQQERLLFFPEKLPAGYRFAFAGQFEELSLPVEGAALSAIHFRAAEPRGVVLYFHGNGGSLGGWGPLAGQFTSRGYDVLMIDYRGYGKSGGAISSEAQLHADALVAYDYLAARYPAEQIVIAGRSLGSGIAARLATVRPARLLILETPYASVLELARRSFPILPGFLLKYPLRTDQLIGQVACPVALIHGDRDELIPYGSSPRLLDLITSEGRLFTIAGAGHNDLSEFRAYEEALDAILH